MAARQHPLNFFIIFSPLPTLCDFTVKFLEVNDPFLEVYRELEFYAVTQIKKCGQGASVSTPMGSELALRKQSVLSGWGPWR